MTDDNNTSSYILCIETANAVTSVAISQDGICCAVKEVLEPNRTADKIHILIEELLSATGLVFSDLSGVAISSGPGSFTGLRIAVAAAKAYCFTLNIPLIAVPTLQAMSYGAQKRYGLDAFREYVPMIDARRMEVYISFYSGEYQLNRHFDSLIIDENFSNLFDPKNTYLLFGNGASKAKGYFQGTNISLFEEFIPSATDLCGFAYDRLLKKAFEDLAYFEPNYAKPFYSTLQAGK